MSNKRDKKVSFSNDIVIHKMICWSFAYSSARKGKWEECVLDRDRFNRRISSLHSILKPVLINKILAMNSNNKDV